MGWNQDPRSNLKDIHNGFSGKKGYHNTSVFKTICCTCVFCRDKQTFAATRPSSVLLEQLAVCVAKGEPVLLVGETGTGKTSTVQYLAGLTGEPSNVRLQLMFPKKKSLT